MKFITLSVPVVMSVTIVTAVLTASVLTGCHQNDVEKKANDHAVITVVNQDNEDIKGNNDIETMTKTQKQPFTVQVFTVDEQGLPLPADSVKWWLQGERNHQHRFNCANAECTAWHGAVATNLPVIIRADASRVKADDKYCSQLYSSEQMYENNIADIRITLTPAGVVCR